MSEPEMMGPAKWCRHCREWWPADCFFTAHSRARRLNCKACVLEAEGGADSGNKGETFHLWQMGESLEIIAQRMGQSLDSVHIHLSRRGVKGLPPLTGWTRNERARTG